MKKRKLNKYFCVWCNGKPLPLGCPQEQLNRFISSFGRMCDKKGPDECWNWLGSKNKKGYGAIRFIKKKSIQAHRASWRIFKSPDPIPKGYFILHKCDNTSCVNPEHLFMGTAADNTRDMINKNRQKKNNGEYYGEKVVQAKLTREMVLIIRQKLEEKIPCTEIAKELNINKYAVYDIKRNKSWKRVI